VLLLLSLALIGFLTTTGADSFKTVSRTDVADVDTGSEEEGGFGKRSTESTSSNQPMSAAVPRLIESRGAIVRSIDHWYQTSRFVRYDLVNGWTNRGPPVRFVVAEQARGTSRATHKHITDRAKFYDANDAPGRRPSVPAGRIISVRGGGIDRRCSYSGTLRSSSYKKQIICRQAFRNLTRTANKPRAQLMRIKMLVARIMCMLALISLSTATAPSKIVVLGGSGFIGSHVCKALIGRGCAVTSISRNGPNTRAAMRLDGSQPTVLQHVKTWQCRLASLPVSGRPGL